MENQQSKKKSSASLVVAGGIAVTPFIGAPVMAQTASDPIADVNAMITSLGTITAGVTAIIIGAMTVRLAIKMVNRLTVKG